MKDVNVSDDLALKLLDLVNPTSFFQDRKSEGRRERWRVRERERERERERC